MNSWPATPTLLRSIGTRYVIMLLQASVVGALLAMLRRGHEGGWALK